MLSYTIFCCLLLVQVKGDCLIEEVKNIIVHLDEKQSCKDETLATSSFLPTKWTGCKWSCLQKGFEAIQTLPGMQNRLSRKIPCTLAIQSISLRIGRMKAPCTSRFCRAQYETTTTGNIRDDETCLNATTGNIIEFLSESKRYLQAVSVQVTTVFPQKQSTVL